jgi:hypothetical protein
MDPYQSPKRGKILWLDFASPRDTVPRFASCRYCLASPRLASSGEDSTQIYFLSTTHIRNMCYRVFCWWPTIDHSFVSLSDSVSLSAKQTKSYCYNKKKKKTTQQELIQFDFSFWENNLIWSKFLFFWSKWAQILMELSLFSQIGIRRRKYENRTQYEQHRVFHWVI